MIYLIARLSLIAIIIVIIIIVIVATKFRLAIKRIKKESGDLADCFPKHCNIITMHKEIISHILKYSS